MFVSNPAYGHMDRHAGTRNRGHLPPDEWTGLNEPDWLFFTELNAHEIPARKWPVSELEE